jgi:hypothetical protein
MNPRRSRCAFGLRSRRPGCGSADHPPIAQRPALCSRSSPRSIAEGAPAWKASRLPIIEAMRG